MRVTNVINHNQSAWQEVSAFWNDDVSQKFYSSGFTVLENFLQDLDRACERLETESTNVINNLNRYSSI